MDVYEGDETIWDLDFILSVLLIYGFNNNNSYVSFDSKDSQIIYWMRRLHCYNFSSSNYTPLNNIQYILLSEDLPYNKFQNILYILKNDLMQCGDIGGIFAELVIDFFFRHGNDEIKTELQMKGLV